jgi:hypothetical protein
MQDDHLEEGISGGKELLHDSLEERLSLHFSLIRSQLDLELLNELGDLILLGVGDSVEDLEDGIQDKLVEGTLELLALVFTSLGPLLGLGVEVVVALSLVSLAIVFQPMQFSQRTKLTQRRSIILPLSTPNFLAYLTANCRTVKAQP